jgi:conjugative transposon TraN protein
MKKLTNSTLLALLLLFFGGGVYAQPGAPVAKATALPPLYLAVTLHKTTHLVFPYAIKSVDRGSPAILVQQAAPLENILRVKAGARDFPETNLTVITADGSLFAFTVSYAESPAALTLKVSPKPGNPVPVALLAAAEGNQAALEQGALLVAAATGNVQGPKARSGGMQLQLGGVFIRGEVLYCQLRIRNRSNIGFDAEQLRFYLRDRQTGRRTASQEQEVAPLYVHGGWETVRGQSEQVLVVALPKMTIPSRQYLAVELLEQRGGRHLQLKVPARTLLHAAWPLPGVASDETYGITL